MNESKKTNRLNFLLKLIAILIVFCVCKSTANAINTVDNNSYNQIVSAKPKLASLSVDNATLSQIFKSDNYIYDVIINQGITTLNINATPLENTTVISKLEYAELEKGHSVCKLVLTAESGDVSIYILNIYKSSQNESYSNEIEINTSSTRSSNSFLTDIKLNGQSLDHFLSENLTYTYNANYDNEKLDIQTFKKGDNQNVILPDDLSLKSGDNTFEISVTSEDGTSSSTYVINVFKKHTSKLKNLKLDDYILIPEFDSNLLEYNVKIPASVTSLNVKAQAYDEEAKIKYSGFKNINESKEAYITVSEPNCEKTVYKININKVENKMSKISIKSGNTINNLLLDFDEEDEYYISLNNDDKKVEITSDDNSYFKIEGLGVYNISQDKETISIKLINEFNESKTYKLNFSKQKDTNNNLKSFDVKIGDTNFKLTPIFDSSIMEYSLRVPTGTSSINVSGVVESEKSTLSGLGNKKINIGINKIVLNVTAESGDTKDYILNVIREASEDNDLKKLIPSSGKLEATFDSKLTTYNLKLASNVDSLSFDVEPNDKNAKVEGQSSQLVPDNTSTRVIKVTAEDGSIKEYIINIVKESGSKKSDANELSNLDINTINKTLKSETFEISRYPDELTNGGNVNYISNINQEMTIEDFKKNLDNEQVIIKIYDSNNNLIKDNSKLISTGMTVKIEINNVEYDSLKIVVRGDIDGDGIIAMTDYIALKSLLLGENNFDFIKTMASDLDYDGVLTMADYIKLKSFILGEINSLNR